MSETGGQTMFKQRRRSNGKRGSSDGRSRKVRNRPSPNAESKKQKDIKIRNRRTMKVNTQFSAIFIDKQILS